MYLNFFQSQISNVFKAIQRESLDVFEMLNVRGKMSLDLVQCKNEDVFKWLPSVLKSILSLELICFQMSFNLRVQIPLYFFQPQISAVFKYFSIADIRCFKISFSARVQMYLNVFECPSLGLDIYFSVRVQVSSNFF